MLALLPLLLAGCATRGFPPIEGIANFDRVDARLMRGAQPTANAIHWLAGQGVTRIVNLRDDPLPGEPSACAAAGVEYVSLPLSSLREPNQRRIAAVMQAIESNRGITFVHCQYGCDRTGLAVACWRIKTGWPRRVAIEEADDYGLSTWLPCFKQAIREFKP